MTRSLSTRLALILVSLAAAACGGGGGTGPGFIEPPPPPGPERLAVLEADLRGSHAVSVVDPEARGVAVLDLRSDGHLAFALAMEPSWGGAAIGARVLRGDPGETGSTVVNLLSAGAAFDFTTFTLSGAMTIDAALAAEIAADPASFFVNVLTSTATGGLVRDQLAPFEERHLHATLLGTEESVVVDAAAEGGATLRLRADGRAAWRAGMRAPDAADLDAVHLHRGDGQPNDPVVVDLDASSTGFDAGTGLHAGDAPFAWLDIARMALEPGRYYVRVHTPGAPQGLARGVVTDAPLHAWGALEADQETVAPQDSDARGGATLQLHDFGTGTVHLAVPPAQDIFSLTGAHVHDGGPGVDGPVVIDLMAGSDFVRSASSFSAEGSIACDQDLFTRILADPADFYFNFHTGQDPQGAARAQLTREPVVFAAAMSGAEETTVVDPAASGAVRFVARDVFHGSFVITMGAPTADTLLAAHIHDGGPGTDGPALIDLLGAPDAALGGEGWTGRVTFTGRTFARLLAVPERFYANVHTALAPGGIARGQMGRLASDLPPVGLAYLSPMNTTEQLPAPVNVPTFGGGAPTAYAVTPALPPGLVLDPETGAIHGTPLATAAAQTYVVTGSNAAGSNVATLQIAVLPVPPTNLVYASPVGYTVGTPIAPNVPTHDGGTVTDYAVAPSLPPGLALDPTTGVISGTPTAAAATADYTVTASNAAGSTDFAIAITVSQNLQAPAGLSYSTPVTYGTGTAITPNTPSISGGAVSSWSVAPSLPPGLSLHATTGVISGTPTTVTSAADYTVTASNAAGSTNATVNITVQLGAPASLSYSNSPNVAYVNTAISSMLPSSQGGAVTSYSVSPSLPSGLTLNTTTGVISGTPTTTSPLSNYTVTATNAAGSTTATIAIVVY